MGDPSSPATISFRTRTVSTPTRPKGSDDITVATSWTAVEAPEDYHDKTAGESPSRARRNISTATSSVSYFTIPKTFSISSSIGLFSRRRKTTTRNASRPQPRADPLEDVIEIGPERQSQDENNEEAERERLRDAAAQALGLGLGREEHKEGDGEGEQDETEATPVSEQPTHPYIHEPTPRAPPRLNTSPAPLSMTSLPHHPMPSPSIATTSPTSDYIPSYPSALSALLPYIQTRSPLLRYHPGTTFLAISINRRTKQWRSRHVVLTAPLPPSLSLTQDMLSVPGQQRRSMAPQHAHLHLFKSATPELDELEIDRLEINEDSVVFVAEQEVAGRRDVVKVGGRDARGGGVTSASASVKSVARSWHSAATSSWEQNIEEMGRTMWLLKTADSGETQHWIKYIKNAVLVQRAERAGMTFHPNGNSSGVPSMRGDLDVLLSLRSQGLLPSATREDTAGLPPATNGTSASPPPNPRFAEHVGAAPSHTSPPPSYRTRSYPTPSTLPSLKGLFSPSPQNNPGPPTPPPDTHANIDPIAEESGSLGTRASALFNMFRSPSRASYGRTNVSPMPMQMPTPTQHMHGIGAPITPGPIVEEATRKTSAPPTSFAIDWNTMQGGNSGATSSSSKHTSLSLPPPPRSRRRPWTSAGTTDVQRRREESLGNGKAVHSELADTEGSSSYHTAHTPTPTPPQSPLLSSPSPQNTRRPPSLNSTSSYASAEKDRTSDISRRPSRAVPKMLAPPTGPPPNAPSMRSHSPSFNNGAPSPIFEQEFVRRNGSGRVDQHANSWGSQNNNHSNNPYSKRISSSSARSVNTASTGHSFLGAKSPPPPRPPPTFAPPPAPPTDQSESSPTTTRNSSQTRDSYLPRSIRLSLLPPAAPPTHSLPPRPDEPGYRHRRSSSSEVKSTSNLFSIPGSPTPPEPPIQPPPAPPPPRGPLPPTPILENDKDVHSAGAFRSPSLTKRLRIMSTPAPLPSTQAVFPESEPIRHSLDRPVVIGEPILSHPEAQPHMFLHMNDTPTTPAMTHSSSFLHVPSPLQTSPDDVEPTSLSPPPRRTSRTSKEIQRTPNLDRDGFLQNGSSTVEPQARDSAVVIEIEQV